MDIKNKVKKAGFDQSMGDGETAGSRSGEPGGNRFACKTCPVCGAVCFSDMEVCYGCLHRFSSQVARAQDAKAEKGMQDACSLCVGDDAVGRCGVAEDEIPPGASEELVIDLGRLVKKASQREGKDSSAGRLVVKLVV